METPRSEEPFNLSQEVGKGFLTGSVLGPAIILARGGGIQALITHTSYASAYCAVWGATYSAIAHARRKEDTMVTTNALALAGACGITSLPKGIPAAARSALSAGAVGVALFGGIKLLQGDTRPGNLSSLQTDR
jgi:hypothetical protein